jgi:hypothetical protein
VRGLGFAEVRVDEPITKTAYVIVKNPSTQITELTSSSPYLEFKQLPMELSEDGTESLIPIEVTLLPGVGLGNLRENITAISSLENKAKAVLRVSGKIKGDIELMPAALRFDRNPIEGENTSKFQKVQVTNIAPDRELNILSVKDPDGMIDVEWKMLQSGQRYEVSGTLNEETFGEKKYFKGAIWIATDHPVYDSIKIEYNIYNR